MTKIDSLFYVLTAYLETFHWFTLYIAMAVSKLGTHVGQLINYHGSIRRPSKHHKEQDYMYRLFSVLCWLCNVYEEAEEAELPGVYFVTNTKH